MTKDIKFVITRFVFSRSKCTNIRFRPGLYPEPRWGSLRRSPKLHSRLGMGIPFPCSPRSTHSASRTRLLFSGPLNSKSWLRQCLDSGVPSVHASDKLCLYTIFNNNTGNNSRPIPLCVLTELLTDWLELALCWLVLVDDNKIVFFSNLTCNVERCTVGCGVGNLEL